MNLPIIDFFIGLTLVNIIPHYLVGILKIRFLGLYGFGAKQNIAYAWTSLLASFVLFHINYGLTSIMDHLWYAGGLFAALAYLLLGKILVKFFREKG